jgi:hypothetical protein
MMLQMGQRYTAIADFSYQDWSSVKTEAPASLKSALRFSAGFEIMPERSELSYLSRIGYRLGAGYEQTYVSVLGTNINDIFGTAGFSLPIGPSGRINLSCKGGVRGSTAGTLQQDTYITINVGMTSSEIWFMEFNED